jgi:hypothetical protein
MCKRKIYRLCLTIALMSVVALFKSAIETTRVHAQEPIPISDHGTCIRCHEDLYFLHDTGNWFCIRESPMRCVDCHGGDPSSLKQEEAHANRKAHPVINEDISKCQECHPAECDERLVKFDQVAGISEVLVAVPYQPTPAPSADQVPATPGIDTVKYINWISAMEMFMPVLLTGLVLAIYFIHCSHQKKTRNKEL